MKYFNQIENVDWNDVQLKNIFQKLELTSEIPENYITYYRIKEGESLESIAYSQYGNVDLWWLIALINDNINDSFYDIALSHSVLQLTAKEHVSFVGKVVTIKTSVAPPSNIADANVYLYSESGGKASFSEWVNQTENSFKVTILRDFFYILDKINFDPDADKYIALVYGLSHTYDIDTPDNYVQAFLDNYNEYEPLNDDKRVIKIIKPDFINNIILDIVRGE